MALFFKKQTELPRRRSSLPIKAERATESELQKRYSFRRNSTLTGSASSTVVSPNESKAQLKSPRVKVHELTKQRRHIGGMLLLVLCSVIGLTGLVSQFTAGVAVKTHDSSQQLDSSYQEAIQTYLAARPAERLRFLTDTNRLSDYLRRKIPEVASVSVEGAAGFGKSTFVLTMRTPIASWSIGSRQHYVDAKGVSFTRNYFAPPPVQIIDNSGVQVETGQTVASNRFLGFVGRTVGLAKSQGYTITQVIIPAHTTREIELRLAGLNYPIKFSVDRGAGEQVEDMARAVKWLTGHNQAPKYLDVRVSGKAFYR